VKGELETKKQDIRGGKRGTKKKVGKKTKSAQCVKSREQESSLQGQFGENVEGEEGGDRGAPTGGEDVCKGEVCLGDGGRLEEGGFGGVKSQSQGVGKKCGSIGRKKGVRGQKKRKRSESRWGNGGFSPGQRWFCASRSRQGP